MNEYKTIITALSGSERNKKVATNEALSPRTIWGKVIIYLREHHLIALHIACGDITDVSMNNGVFEIKTTENFLYELLSSPENHKELLNALGKYGISKFEVIKKDVVLTDNEKDIIKLKEFFGDKLTIEGE